MITYIVTNYNYGAYINACLESISRQKGFRESQLIILDDCSTDDSNVVIDSFSNQFDNIINYKSETNVGKIALLNLAVQWVSKPMTVIVDSDDVLYDNFIEKCLTVFNGYENNGRVDFIYTNCELIDSKGSHLGIGYSTEFSPKLINSQSYIPECALTKSNILKSVFPLDSEVRKGTKHLKWKKIIDNGGIGVHLNECLFYYRMHGLNLSGIGSKVMKSVNEEKKDIFILSGLWPKYE